MNPFHVLQLDPDTTDPKAVKRSYAQLIRQHRPDEDPEQFRQIREAYECLEPLIKNHPDSAYLDNLRRLANDSNEPPIANPDYHLNENEYETIDKEVLNNDAEATEDERNNTSQPNLNYSETQWNDIDATKEAERLHQAFTQDEISADQWDQSFTQLAHQYPQYFTTCDLTLYIKALDANQGDAINMALSYWRYSLETTPILQFSELWADHAESSMYYQAGHLCMSLATTVCFLNYPLGEHHNNLAFELTPHQERNPEAHNDADTLLSICKYMQGQDSDLRAFYMKLITTGEWNDDSGNDLTKEAYQYVRTEGHSSGLLAYIENIRPDFLEATDLWLKDQGLYNPIKQFVRKISQTIFRQIRLRGSIKLTLFALFILFKVAACVLQNN